MMTYRLILGVMLLFAGCARPDAGEANPEAASKETAAADTASAQTRADAPDFTVAGLEEPAVRAFFERLQQAVARDDRRQVAALVAYPITVQIQEQPMTLKDAADFVAHYPAVMNEHVRAAVREAEVADLFVNWQGVRIGRGEVWFGGVAEGEEADQQSFSIKIVAINGG